MSACELLKDGPLKSSENPIVMGNWHLLLLTGMDSKHHMFDDFLGNCYPYLPVVLLLFLHILIPNSPWMVACGETGGQIWEWSLTFLNTLEQIFLGSSGQLWIKLVWLWKPLHFTKQISLLSPKPVPATLPACSPMHCLFCNPRDASFTICKRRLDHPANTI